MSEQNRTPPPERLALSSTQVVASVLATISASTAASFFGVAGTVIGAALGSVVTVVGSAVYSWSIRRTRRRVRETLDVAVSRRFNGTVGTTETGAAADLSGTGTSLHLPIVREPAPRPAKRSLPWKPKQLALVAGGLFVLTLAMITGFELVSGQPLGATVTGKHGTGTSIGGGHTKKAAQPTVSVTPPSSPTSTAVAPSASTSATEVSPSATPTPTSSAPETSAAPSDSASDTATTPSATPTATATTPAG